MSRLGTKNLSFSITEDGCTGTGTGKKVAHLGSESILGLSLWLACILYSSLSTATTSSKLVGSDRMLVHDTATGKTVLIFVFLAGFGMFGYYQNYQILSKGGSYSEQYCIHSPIENEENHLFSK